MPDLLLCPPSPCSTCPYRRDTPPGIWDATEYRKLPEYDPDAEVPAIAPFHCHHETGTGIPTVCRGWLAVHGTECVAVRVAIIRGEVTVEDAEAPVPVELYGSGREACAAGLRGIKRPSAAARRQIAKLVARGGRAHSQPSHERPWRHAHDRRPRHDEGDLPAEEKLTFKS